MPAEENASGLQALLEQAQQLQQGLATVQQELAATSVEGSAAGGLVVATVSGSGELTGLTIDPKLADPADTETLADAVVAAVRAANAAAAKVRADKLGPLESGLTQLGGGLGGLPGLT